MVVVMSTVTGRRSRLGRQHSSKKNMILRVILVLLVLLVAVLFLFPATLVGSSSTSSSTSITTISTSTTTSININDDDATNKCWIKKAIQSKKLKLFSHRSFGNASLTTSQPTCKESLLQLKSIGVNHFDLDLVLGNISIREKDDASRSVVLELEQEKNSDRVSILIVAHPMEYKHVSNYYSPCSNIDFDSFIATLKSVYGGESSNANTAFFLSLEPKAAWHNTPQEIGDPALTNHPSDILQMFLQAIKRHELKGQCAAIVDIPSNSNSNIEETEETEETEINQESILLKQILQHCEHYSGVRITDPIPMSLGEFDRIMPTIEFHPKHSHNPLQQHGANANGGINSDNYNNNDGTAVEIPRRVLDNSILWTVDDKQDLLMAAEMRPYGIVSNVPLTINAILQDPDWCNTP
mmetsp:Transcript_16344/g.24428  ORF Transcript_16344/g.24428 Transcript_16344/m.24428 type:complete len:410 (+) Transcript_16344:221-1450(+)